jgi:hypothetical protein
MSNERFEPQTLLKCKNDGKYRSLFAATRAILFFGTPHNRMEVEALRPVAKGQPSRQEILDQLKKGSSFLNEQREDIINLWDSGSGIDILSFYETRKTKTVGKVHPWKLH